MNELDQLREWADKNHKKQLERQRKAMFPHPAYFTARAKVSVYSEVLQRIREIEALQPATEPVQEYPYKFRISCWNCRATREMESKEAPQFGFEVAQAATAAGWKGIHDPYWGRVLVFCSDSCIDACETKAGHIRKCRPKPLLTHD